MAGTTTNIQYRGRRQMLKQLLIQRHTYARALSPTHGTISKQVNQTSHCHLINTRYTVVMTHRCRGEDGQQSESAREREINRRHRT